MCSRLAGVGASSFSHQIVGIVVALAAAQSVSAAISASGNTSPNPTTPGNSPVIGSSDIGRMTITAGSSLLSNIATLGDSVNAIGLVTVTDFNSGTGSASTWTPTTLVVANAGTGQLEILNGAVVNVDFATSPGAGDLFVGNSADGVGTIIVNGLGSLLRLGDESTIGVLGTGILRIENEGYVIGTNDAATGTDIFTVGTRGRVELSNGRLRTDVLTNNGAIVGTGRVDSEDTIANTTTGRFEVDPGDRLVVDAVVDNDGEIAIVGGEIEFLRSFSNSNMAAAVTLRGGGTVRFPVSGFGFDSTSAGGVLATTAGTNDIYGTVRIQGASSRIVVAGESTAVFHEPVTNSGATIEVFPGSSAVYLHSLTTTGSGSALTVHLADPNEDPDFGSVEVGGAAALGGTLRVQLASGFAPSAGDAFQILTAAGGITGSLSLASAPALSTGLQWDLDINTTAVVLSVISTGDYNGNGVVDAADYIVWRKTLNQTGSNLAADGNGNGIVDSGDYDHWRSRFGSVIGTGLAAGASGAIPEPATSLLLLLSAIFPSCRRRSG
jgi:T5SS/PEP-CTERM-associated repeat protein